MRYLIILIATLLFSADLIIQYPNLKKEYYENQIIDLNIKVITPKEMNLTVVPPLGSEINITKTSPFVYQINLKYKNDNEIKKMFILSKNLYKEIVLNNLYNTSKIEKIKDFCNVLAKDLKINNTISSKYDKKYNIISFTLIGKDANLKDFTLHLKDENLTVISPEKATYLGLVDNKQQKIKFYYFNTDNDNYQKIEIPINIKEETISTQTDLNPEENTLFTPINIFVLSIIAILTIIFLVYQKVWLLIPPLLLTGFLVYNNLPKGEAYLSRGTKIYILPTKNSTVFYQAPIGTKVKILKKSKHYTKIKIKNKIGWVKNEDIR
ncbi:conserved hypothetical protein [Nautilia profundicola AmH]|uniref:Periplasmic protein n=1 Tax=Nautilia profundicola (strain ATCC BAA-1463 / DSM 18972 / AmH) TaxID=598659 RepID=B9L8V1_NAUPA|nr:SH3 domain-containing protein [Nautilia profundicola]ACM93700.1 conserved hypothetical protein [Nautilia profundicola AmH]